jgi:Transposase
LGLTDAFEKLPPCIVGMETCLSAHFVSRTLRALGHEPRIIPAIYVKPFLKGQKNDYNDAEAIAEAALRPNLRVVQEKSQDQLDLQACHRVRFKAAEITHPRKRDRRFESISLRRRVCLSWELGTPARDHQAAGPIEVQLQFAPPRGGLP